MLSGSLVTWPLEELPELAHCFSCIPSITPEPVWLTTTRVLRREVLVNSMDYSMSTERPWPQTEFKDFTEDSTSLASVSSFTEVSTSDYTIL